MITMEIQVQSSYNQPHLDTTSVLKLYWITTLKVLTVITVCQYCFKR